MTFEELQSKIDDLAATGDVKGFKRLHLAIVEEEDDDEDMQMVLCDYLQKRKRAMESRLSGAIMEAQQWEYEAEIMEQGYY